MHPYAFTKPPMTHIDRLRLPDDDPTFGGNRIFDLFQYSPAVTANGMVVIAGQIGLRPELLIESKAVAAPRKKD